MGHSPKISGLARGAKKFLKLRHSENFRSLDYESLEEKRLLSAAPTGMELCLHEDESIASINSELATDAGDALPGAAEAVADILVSSTQWTDRFLDYLDSSGLGSGGYSVRHNDTAENLSWSNIDQIKIVFDQDVEVFESDLMIFGVNVGDYFNEIGFVPDSFVHDAESNTATWTLREPIGPDKLFVGLMPGDLPIPDIFAPDDSNARFEVLPGDGNRDGKVDIRDAQDLRTRNLALAGAPERFRYSEHFDFNGSGSIDLRQIQILRENMLNTLPEGSPGDNLAFAASAEVFAVLSEESSEIPEDLAIEDFSFLEEVVVGSREWTNLFLDYLDSEGLGSGGFRVDPGEEVILPWVNINQIRLTFSEDVNLTLEDLSQFGFDVDALGSVLDVMVYDPESFTITWNLADSIAPESKIQTISRDGSAEPAYTFFVLPGDGNRDGKVDIRDAQDLRQRNLALAGAPERFHYSEFFDFNGSGSIDLRQIQILRENMLNTILD